MEAETGRISAEELRKNDRLVTNASGIVTGSIETYCLKVLPLDLVSTIRAVALQELRVQEVDLDNKASQIIVDNLPASKKSIDRAMRRVVMRFQDSTALIKAIEDIYNLLQRITRIQVPPKNSIIARQNFHLWVDMTDLGILPTSMAKLKTMQLSRDVVVRVVGPLVPYGRKLFWNPIGTSATMKFRRVKTKRLPGVRFLPSARGASLTAPRFKPYAPSTLRKVARKDKSGNAAQALSNMLSGAAPPGRSENAGQIVKRVMKRMPQYRGLHFTDGWVEYPAAASWSKLRDSRVPAMGVMFSKKGALPGTGVF